MKRRVKPKARSCPPHHTLIEGEEFAGVVAGGYLYRWWGRCKKCRRRRSGESVRPLGKE